MLLAGCDFPQATNCLTVFTKYVSLQNSVLFGRGSALTGEREGQFLAVLCSWSVLRAEPVPLSSLLDAVQVLNLSKSPDLVCENLMCAKSGLTCYCKLLVALQRLPHLLELDLSNNGLSEMPDILTADTVPSLTTLRMTGNQLETIPMGMLELPKLQV